MKTLEKEPKTVVDLPDLPSALLKLALEDLAMAEKSPKYVVDMGEWHGPVAGGKCKVCLAGATMAFGLGIDPSLYIEYKCATDSFHPLSPSDSNKMFALDSLRQGDVEDALVHLDLDFPKNALAREVTSYNEDPQAWRKDMEQIVSDLEAVGL